MAGLPAAVVGGSALVVYAVIAVMGVEMLARAELGERSNSLVAALALAVGLLPLLAPGLYGGFPGWIRTIAGSGVVAGTLAAVLLHALFGASAAHRGVRAPRPEPVGRRRGAT